jgi:hypothetical protein
MLVGETATVTAFIGEEIDDVVVTCAVEIGPEIEIIVSANPASNVPGGTSIISAIVTYEGGGVVSDNTTVYFYTNSGELSATSADTTNGIATVDLTLDDNMQGGTTATITAFIGSKEETADVTCIDIIVTIYADDYIIVPVTGTSAITAVVTEPGGEPINPEVIVIFFAKDDTGDDIGILTPVHELTSGGIAETVLSGLDTGDVVTVTAKCGSRVSNEIIITTE